MTADVENLVLEQLRLLRNDVQSFRVDLLAETADIKHRLSVVEAAVLSVRRDTVSTDTELARHQAIMDRFAQRLERIERRLELLP